MLGRIGEFTSSTQFLPAQGSGRVHIRTVCRQPGSYRIKRSCLTLSRLWGWVISMPKGAVRLGPVVFHHPHHPDRQWRLRVWCGFHDRWGISFMVNGTPRSDWMDKVKIKVSAFSARDAWCRRLRCLAARRRRILTGVRNDNQRIYSLRGVAEVVRRHQLHRARLTRLVVLRDTHLWNDRFKI